MDIPLPPEESIQLHDPITLDDLVRAYIRYKEWMDYDEVKSAYCLKEIMILQSLFGISYITPPAALRNASYPALLNVMTSRIALLTAYFQAIENPKDDLDTEEVLEKIQDSNFTSTVHYFTTLFEAITSAAENAAYSPSGNVVLDEEPFEDHFAELDEALNDEIRAFILEDHPGIAEKTFPLATVYEMGLPMDVPKMWRRI